MYKAFVFITVEIAPESEKKIELHLIKSETKCIFQIVVDMCYDEFGTWT